ATRRIRSGERERSGPMTPIVALTGNATREDRANAIAAGMSAFLSKPFRREELEAVAARWLPARESVATPETNGTPCDTAAPIDEGALDELDRATPAGARSLASRVIEMFDREARRELDGIKQAIARGDLDAARRTSHRLKSSARTVGANEAADLCAAIETAVRESREDGVAALVHDLEGRIAEALPSLRVIARRRWPSDPVLGVEAAPDSPAQS
ncbi:MAG: Hpt domain-containing protein, partial [Gemmatimonadetes bacterium]|nr:Hpt domain-containing protein [Gemmatimonadota bacterium]